MVRWPFRRKPEESDTVPAEIQEYYDAERRERRGLAWLLAAGTLLVTIGIVVGLFYGGRWAYRQVRGTDTSQQTQTEQTPQETTSPETAQTPTETSTENQTNETQTESATEPTATQTPNTGSSLPATGPTESE